jgi:hypothetical protein
LAATSPDRPGRGWSKMDGGGRRGRTGGSRQVRSVADGCVCV